MDVASSPLRNGRIRCLLALGCLCAFAFSLALSAAPQWHESVHKASGAADHHCAATLIASGGCDHHAGGDLLAQPAAKCEARPSFPHHFLQIVATLVFSRLEHAPPRTA